MDKIKVLFLSWRYSYFSSPTSKIEYFSTYCVADMLGKLWHNDEFVDRNICELRHTVC